MKKTKKTTSSFALKSVYMIFNEHDVPVPFKSKNKVYVDDCCCIPADTYGNGILQDLSEIYTHIKNGNFFDIPTNFYYDCELPGRSKNYNKIKKFKKLKEAEYKTPINLQIKLVYFEISSEFAGIQNFN